jgi:hypothetical protein
MVEKKATVREGTNSLSANDFLQERVLQLTFYAHDRINNLPQNTSLSESKGGSIAVYSLG